MSTSAKDVFQRIYDENGWEHPESVSGRGAMLRETSHQSGVQFDRCLCLWAFEDVPGG